jgi:hypothetical protein
MTTTAYATDRDALLNALVLLGLSLTDGSPAADSPVFDALYIPTYLVSHPADPTAYLAVAIDTGGGIDLDDRPIVGPGDVIAESQWGEPRTWYTPEAVMAYYAKSRMIVYEIEPSPDVTGPDELGRYTSASGRIVRPYAMPQWWQDACAFIHTTIASLSNPLPEPETLPPGWHLHDSRAAARYAGEPDPAFTDALVIRQCARIVGRDAATEALVSMARRAILAASLPDVAQQLDTVIGHLAATIDLPIPAYVLQPFTDRIDLWRSGYGIPDIYAAHAYRRIE